MRALRRAVLFLALTSGVAMGIAQTREPGDRPRRPRIVAELSDLLTHSPLATCTDPRGTAANNRVRIATWNIQAARTSPVDVLAAEMQAMQADVIALQEVDVKTKRGGFVDAPTTLAAALGFNYVFAASILWDEGHYGLGLLSRLPIAAAQRHRLGGADLGEPRIVLDVTVCAGAQPIRLLNHHADRRVAARALGFADLGLLVRPAIGQGILLAGDMNEYPDGPGVRSLIESGLTDLGAEGNGFTSTSGRIDYLLADAVMSRRASPVRVWTTDKSDHHAIYVDFEW